MNPEQKPMNSYVPGVCNIGDKEIAARKRFGWIGLVVTIIVWIIFKYFSLASGWYLLLFFPASMSATGFIQGFSHFCAGFGLKGLFNFGPEVGKTDTVKQAEYRAQDKKKALQIFGYSILVGAAVALAALLF